MNHILHRERTNDSIVGSCSCDRFFIESHGNDECSLSAVVRQFETHVEAVAA